MLTADNKTSMNNQPLTRFPTTRLSVCCMVAGILRPHAANTDQEAGSITKWRDEETQRNTWRQR